MSAQTAEEKDLVLIRTLVRKAGGRVVITPRELMAAEEGTVTVYSDIDGNWIVEIQ